MNDDLFFYYNFGIDPLGQSSVQMAPADDANESVEASWILPTVAQAFGLIAEPDEEDEAAVPQQGDVFADDLALLTASVEAFGGAVVAATEGSAFGTDGGDLLMGDGGIDAGVIAELMASIGADFGA